ncbi:hypothetical protein [Photobacterium ganghwense]|uniref:hypothetical protein n=1 Tax=Photobacterium ganghwense TaxID=320778 RepID=UPI000A5A476A|nr:hypothetical protein [Photobacterium ganghwense]MBV1839825.1 hypothetical protein [Photobacterium ganghwense]QSV16019.1 hypothetical protein FH974_22545 [Photobacterium ganghwense]
MSLRSILGIVVGALSLTGCQLTQSQTVSHTFNDPVTIHDYQLPVYPEGQKLLTNYRQRRNEELWFWSELDNTTFQRGENLIVQVVSKKPLEQPPSLFAFAMPSNPGERKYNAVGPYQRWVNVMPNGDRCVYAQQHTRKMEQWLSIFIHYCAPENRHSLTWLDELKPSFYLEDFPS